MRAAISLAVLLLAACATAPRQQPVRAEVGVAFDRNGEIASFAEGIADPQSVRRATADDPVSVVSVSKMVVAIELKYHDSGGMSRWQCAGIAVANCRAGR